MTGTFAALDLASRGYGYTNDWLNLGLSLFALAAVLAAGAVIVKLSPPDAKAQTRRIAAAVAMAVILCSAAAFLIT